MARIVRTAMVAALGALVTATPGHAAKKPTPQPVAVAAAPSVRAAVDLWRGGDYAGAVAMWMPFANAGDPDAMFNIGQAYKLGRAVPKDAVVARDWYRRAAQKGHLPAQANLGILLFQAGEKAEAVRWLKAAADKNEMRAQYVLGVANWNGDGLPRNLTLAYAYLQRASAQGLAEATPALANLAPMLSPVERANGLAVASSLVGGNGVPAAFAGPPTAFATNEPYRRDQIIKPLPAPTVAAPVPSAPPPAATAAAPPRPLPVTPPAVAVAAAAPVVAAAASPGAAVAPPARPTVATVVAPAAPVAAPAVVAPVARPVAAPAAVVVPAPKPAPVVAQVRTVAPPVTTVTIPPSPASPPAVETVAAPKPATKPVEVATVAPRDVAKPTEAVATGSTPVAKPAPAVSGWRIQLGAFSKRAQAEAAWKSVEDKQKKTVAGVKPIYQANGTITKLQLGPYANEKLARDTCAKLAFSGNACFVTNS